MAVSVTTDIFCDGKDCGAWEHGVTGRLSDAKGARHSVKRYGWTNEGSRDFCPTCSSARQAARRALTGDQS